MTYSLPGLQGISLPCHALLALLASLLTELTITTPSDLLITLPGLLVM